MTSSRPQGGHLKTVNLATLKAELSRYVRAARAGEEVIVLDRQTPVAKLVPYREEHPSKLLVHKPAADPAGLAAMKLPPIPRKRIDSVAVLLEDRRQR